MKFVQSVLCLSIFALVSAQDDDQLPDNPKVGYEDEGGIDAFTAFTSSGSTCKDCDDVSGCLVCTGKTRNHDGSYTLTIDGGDCLVGGARDIDWACCGGVFTESGGDTFQADLCDLHEEICHATYDGTEFCGCESDYVVTVPHDTTSVVFQFRDYNIKGDWNVEWSHSCWRRDRRALQEPVSHRELTYYPCGRKKCEQHIDISTCPCTGLCAGDPHIKTWGGYWYDYMGECDLVFLTEPTFADGLGLDIHIRTTARDDFSYIEAAAIRVGDDILEVGGHGEYLLNGVDSAELPAKLGPFDIQYEMENKKKHHFIIPYGDGKAIEIHTVKDLVTVQMANASKVDLEHSQGLMGEFGTGHLLGRDGKTKFHDDYNGFGQEWQVREDEPKLFDTDRFPQHPAKCVIPDKSTATHRRLGEGTVRRDEAEEACSHWGDGMSRCVQDVLAMDDLEVADAGGLFKAL